MAKELPVSPLSIEGTNIFVWLLQSSVIVALVAAILYAFGANFDYRLRWEFGIQNVYFQRATSDLTYDGLIVVSAWFRTFQPFLILAVGTLGVFVFRLKFFSKHSSTTKLIAKVLLAFALVATSGLLTNYFLRTRAAGIASVMRQRAGEMPHSVFLANGTAVEGYILNSSEERSVVLTNAGNVQVVPAKEIQSISLSSR